MMSITLNGKQIRDLAQFAGFTIVEHEYSDEYETELTITQCPKDGVLDDEGKATKYEFVAYLSEYPEEGVMPLGDGVAINGKV